MIDRQRLFFKVRGHKAFSSTYEKIIKDKGDNASVRNEAVLSYSDGVAKEPARGDLLMQIAADKSDERGVRRAALYGLSELRSDDAAARRKQAADLIVKLVAEELDQFGSAAPERLAPIGSANHLQKLIAIDTANKSEASGNMLAHAVRSFGKQKHIQGKGGAKAMAKAAKAVFKGKGANYIKPYAFDGIVAFGGKKMRAICKTLEKDPDAGIAGKAKNCVKSLSKK